MAHQAGAYPGFRSMKRLRVFLLPPGWDASPSQGYPPALNYNIHVIYKKYKQFVQMLEALIKLVKSQQQNEELISIIAWQFTDLHFQLLCFVDC